MAGRHTRLTHALIQAMVEAIENAMPVVDVCRAQNIGESTYYTWLKKAEDPSADPIYLEFREAVTRARATAMERLVNTIQVASLDPKNWRAAAWLLERGWPATWAETLNLRTKAEVTLELAKFLAMCRSECTPDAWEQVKAVAERMDGSAGDSREDASAPLH